MLIDPHCVACGKVGEDQYHALFSCKIARNVWLGTDLSWLCNYERQSRFLDWMQSVTETMRLENLGWFCVAVWMLWNDRNQGVMGKDRRDGSRIMREAKIYAESFIANIEAKGHVHALSVNSRWCPPPVGLYKINVDGAWREGQSIGGLGCVVRDVNGCFIAGFSKGNTRAAEVVVCEALAARDALAFALDIGLSKVVLEMDNSVVINAIKHSDRELSELGGICADIKRLGQRLQHFEVQHVPRSCNKVAHVLAKKALDLSNMIVWMEKAPDDIVHLLLADCSSAIS